MNRTIGTIALIFIAVLTGCQTRTDREHKLMADIDQLMALGDKASPALLESLHRQIKAQPVENTSLLLAKLNDAKINSSQRAAYLWALGIAGKENSVDAIIECTEKSGSDLVKKNGLRALGEIGGEKAGAFLLAQFGKTTDPEMRFEMLNLLAQMQYEKALPATMEILKKGSKYYWQSIFVFGKMGDKGVPFLLTKVNDPDRNVRVNVINLLGKWLLAVEAESALRNRFWQENEPAMRGLILSSLEYVTVDLDANNRFSTEVLAREKDPDVRKYAKETIDCSKEIIAKLIVFKKGKRISSGKFDKAYDEIYQSVGKRGDYRLLSKASNLDDELRLKTLRERILQRNSDESFYDYDKVNHIIMYNRWLAKNGLLLDRQLAFERLHGGE